MSLALLSNWETSGSMSEVIPIDPETSGYPPERVIITQPRLDQGNEMETFRSPSLLFSRLGRGLGMMLYAGIEPSSRAVEYKYGGISVP